jgi:molybdopterin converting factor small subunit
MISIHLYGKLRRFATNRGAQSDSILLLSHEAGDTVGAIVDRIGIPRGEVGSNIFRNGRYADLNTPISDGDRLGLFPDDMQLLYKWYFSPSQGSEPENPNTGSDSLQAHSDVQPTAGGSCRSRGSGTTAPCQGSEPENPNTGSDSLQADLDSETKSRDPTPRSVRAGDPGQRTRNGSRK